MTGIAVLNDMSKESILELRGEVRLRQFWDFGIRILIHLDSTKIQQQQQVQRKNNNKEKQINTTFRIRTIKIIMLEVRTQGFYHLKEYNEGKRIKCEIRRILIILIVKYSSTQSESIWISRKLQKWEGVENVCRGLSRTVTKRILKGKMGLVSLRVSDNCLLFV
jgi:predicted methyltransferase